MSGEFEVIQKFQNKYGVLSGQGRGFYQSCGKKEWRNYRMIRLFHFEYEGEVEWGSSERGHLMWLNGISFRPC